MTQFKAKRGNQDQDQAGVGLFTYPVLMAADILVYGASRVPVGDDQRQHLELARQIASSANHRYAESLFVVPETMLADQGTRVMSLTDGTSKMSKSDKSDKSRINMNDDADAIVKKLKKAKTDAVAGVSYDVKLRPEVSNLVDIYACMSGSTVEQVCSEYTASTMGHFKAQLADLVVEHVCPIGSEMARLRADLGYVDQVLKQGALTAAERAELIMDSVRKAVGTRTPIRLR